MRNSDERQAKQRTVEPDGIADRRDARPPPQKAEVVEVSQGRPGRGGVPVFNRRGGRGGVGGQGGEEGRGPVELVPDYKETFVVFYFRREREGEEKA